MTARPGMRVKRPGLQTTLQDWPGRVGYWNVGIPPSGPMDSLSFRLANRLVGNEPGEVGIEFQFLGPELEFLADASVAIVGGKCGATLDGEPFPTGEVVAIGKGQSLNCGAVLQGARAYLAVAGGFATPSTLGSCATFPRAKIGGATLTADMDLHFADPTVRRVGYSANCGESHLDCKVIEVVAGPHLDWLSQGGLETLVGGSWKVSSRMDRTGIRLEGPPLDFSNRAHQKAPENGTDPSNVINTGYPIGGVNICGGTPIILPCDGPSQGGFITPIVVATAALRKVGQLRPNQVISFQRITLVDAVALYRASEKLAHSGLIETPHAKY